MTHLQTAERAGSARPRQRALAGRGSGQPDPCDVHVGRMVKARRVALDISQEDLAGAIGVTFQQVQKYESGHNRVSASRLWAISQHLSCPIEHFFAGYGGEAPLREAHPMSSPETAEDVNLLARLGPPDSEARAHLRAFLSIATRRLA